MDMGSDFLKMLASAGCKRRPVEHILKIIYLLLIIKLFFISSSTYAACTSILPDAADDVFQNKCHWTEPRISFMQEICVH